MEEKKGGVGGGQRPNALALVQFACDLGMFTL